MKQELKGWIMDTNFSTEEEKGQILRLESAGSIGLREVVEEMSREGTGLRPETLAHVVSLYQRVLTRLVLSGYSVNTGMFRLAPGFKGLVEGGVWDAGRNSIRVTFTQGKELRQAIAQTPVKILGCRAEGIVILSGRDTSTGATDFTSLGQILVDANQDTLAWCSFCHRTCLRAPTRSPSPRSGPTQDSCSASPAAPASCWR